MQNINLIYMCGCICENCLNDGIIGKRLCLKCIQVQIFIYFESQKHLFLIVMKIFLE